MDITVTAKVRWLTEDDMETAAEDYDGEFCPEVKFVWGPITVPVEDIKLYWGQSSNRSVIECKNGRLILVAMSHKELCEKITEIKEEMYQRQLDLEDETDEEDLVLGQEEDTDNP